MIQALFTNRWVLYVLVTVSVFIEMYGAKRAYLWLTKKITNEKVRTSVNLLLGVVFSFLLAAVNMWALCDWFGGTFYWKFVIAAAGTATGVYIAYEKIFKNADFTAIGKVVDAVLSHSDLFEGKISAKGLVSFKQQLLSMVTKIDTDKAKEENKAVDDAVARFSSFLADGKVTEEERAEADKLLAAHEASLKNNPTVAKYYELLNGKN